MADNDDDIVADGPSNPLSGRLVGLCVVLGFVCLVFPFAAKWMEPNLFPIEIYLLSLSMAFGMFLAAVGGLGVREMGRLDLRRRRRYRRGAVSADSIRWRPVGNPGGEVAGRSGRQPGALYQDRCCRGHAGERHKALRRTEPGSQTRRCSGRIGKSENRRLHRLHLRARSKPRRYGGGGQNHRYQGPSGPVSGGLGRIRCGRNQPQPDAPPLRQFKTASIARCGRGRCLTAAGHRARNMLDPRGQYGRGTVRAGLAVALDLAGLRSGPERPRSDTAARLTGPADPPKRPRSDRCQRSENTSRSVGEYPGTVCIRPLQVCARRARRHFEDGSRRRKQGGGTGRPRTGRYRKDCRSSRTSGFDHAPMGAKRSNRIARPASRRPIGHAA